MRLYNPRKLIEYDATGIFEDESPSWQWCNSNATFSHKDACEFILHIPDEEDYFNARIEQMRRGGCSEEMIRVYRTAKKRGAEMLLLWA